MRSPELLLIEIFPHGVVTSSGEPMPVKKNQSVKRLCRAGCCPSNTYLSLVPLSCMTSCQDYGTDWPQCCQTSGGDGRSEGS